MIEYDILTQHDDMPEFDKELSDALDTVWQAGFERGKLEGNK